MPRRLPIRTAKVIGNMFVLLVFIVIGFIYVTYMKVWLGRVKDHWTVYLLLEIFNMLFVMLIWSFFQAMTTDPGQVPVFWGFYLGDSENKRRRYCLMCNIFKPERCHHCSACNRCVLNMDHHCPWINNCVGFWNRKFFMLLLIYVLLTTYFVAGSLFYDYLQSLQWALDVYYYSNKKEDRELLALNLMIQVAFMLNGTICVLMTMFLKFHINLGLTNKTTIENLDKKGKDYVSMYDVGSTLNWQQIFGQNKWLWPFPVYMGSGKPLGDGIYWPMNKAEEERMLSSSRRAAGPAPVAAADQNRNNRTPVAGTAQQVQLSQVANAQANNLAQQQRFEEMQARQQDFKQRELAMAQQQQTLLAQQNNARAAAIDQQLMQQQKEVMSQQPQAKKRAGSGQGAKKLSGAPPAKTRK